MKKYLLLLLISCVGLASCKKEVLVQDDTLPNLTVLKYVTPSQWIPSNNGYTLSVDIPVAELDEDTFENDDVSLMISRQDDNTYEKIPFVYDGQAYSYEIRPGFVTLYIQTSGDNILTPITPTTRTRVKIVLITSSL
ncbi:hypothetical protein [Pedobacter hartonius]|uniref:Uncharacterized protein n=1 Tax=Pedobacter hartonius TaxID=425514 RepID=A0A1H4E7U5_9SPHI|nr:hypothetical protein [Pedobacter hartonius]SEA80798.1 hypothetical protein SAMN05443550_105274 [Pedobacter hartonius]